MIKDPQVWYEPLEEMAAARFENRFMAYVCTGLIGGFVLMIVFLGTFNFQLYEWNLTTTQKTYFGFIAMLIGAGIMMLLTYLFIKLGPLWPRLRRAGISEEDQYLAFAVYYYQRWTMIRTWIIRIGLILATAVIFVDRYFDTQLQIGLEMTTPVFYAFTLYLLWAEFQLFRRLGSIPNVVTRSITIAFIIGTISTCLGFLIIMPELFGGLSLIDLSEIGFSNNTLFVLSVLVLIGSEWGARAVRHIERQSRLNEILKS